MPSTDGLVAEVVSALVELAELARALVRPTATPRPGATSPRARVPKFGDSITHDRIEPSAVRSGGPPLHGDGQDGHPGFGGQGRLRLAGPARTQRGGDRGGVMRSLASSRPVARGWRRSPPGVGAPGRVRLPEHGRGGVESHGHGIKRSVGWRSLGHGSHDPVLEKRGSSEEHFSLVLKVPEEGPFGEAGSLGDLGRSGLVEPSLGVEGESSFMEPSATVRLPSTHTFDPSVDSHRHRGLD